MVLGGLVVSEVVGPVGMVVLVMVAWEGLEGGCSGGFLAEEQEGKGEEEEVEEKEAQDRGHIVPLEGKGAELASNCKMGRC